jgi:hypothetical protein
MAVKFQCEFRRVQPNHRSSNATFIPTIFFSNQVFFILYFEIPIVPGMLVSKFVLCCIYIIIWPQITFATQRYLESPTRMPSTQGTQIEWDTHSTTITFYYSLIFYFTKTFNNLWKDINYIFFSTRLYSCLLSTCFWQF